MLKAHIMIHRGQTVTIVVRNDGLNIHMMGKALMDGSENQRIRVENTNSKRVIEGIVRSSEQVEVLVY
jgi:flagella basal body P-ring formation protein FlgA